MKCAAADVGALANPSVTVLERALMCHITSLLGLPHAPTFLDNSASSLRLESASTSVHTPAVVQESDTSAFLATSHAYAARSKE